MNLLILVLPIVALVLLGIAANIAGADTRADHDKVVPWTPDDIFQRKPLMMRNRTRAAYRRSRHAARAAHTTCRDCLPASPTPGRLARETH